MKKILFFTVFLILSCQQKQQVHPPVGGVLSENDLQISKNRAKNLNLMERNQIQDWIDHQDKKFFSTGLNYWIDIENLETRLKKNDGETVSYQYDLYDFNQEKLYEKSIQNKDAVLGKFDELKAVENAIRYLKSGENATLLVPSTLAFGTYGDNDKIQNDVPVIIKLKIF